MEKQSLVSIIDKYYLSGIGEKVKWSVKDKIVTIKTFSPTKDMVGIVTAPLDLPDSEFVIFDTSKFIKLISICGQFLTMDIQSNGKIATKIHIADKEYNLEYALANLMLAPQINFTIEEFDSDYSFNIEKEFVDKWIKAKKALGSEICTMKMKFNAVGIPEVNFTLGEVDGHSNKVTFETPLLDSKTVNESSAIKFNADYLKEIFDANYKSTGVAYVNQEGAIKLDFESEDGQKSSYIILAKI